MRRFLALTAAAAAVAAVGVGVAAAPAGATPPHTAIGIVRPVHANGVPVSGYHVVNETQDGFVCGEASPVAVSVNIRMCGPSATYTVACWKSAGHTVLCLRDPRAKVLYRIRYSGTFAPIGIPRHASPMGLTLDNHATCLIRDGGAWGRVPSHPTWVGFYWCSGHTGDIYGPINGDGINRSSRLWTVETVAPSARGAITRRGVTSAYYVGTAA